MPDHMPPAAAPRTIAISVWGLGSGAFYNVARTLAMGFRQHGIAVDLIHVRSSERSTALRLPSSITRTHLRASRSLLSFSALARYLRTRRPDVLISIGWMQNGPALLAKLLSRWRGTLILTERAHMSYKVKVEHRDDWRFRLLPRLARALYPVADGLVTAQEDVLRDLIENIGLSRNKLPMKAINNPIDIESIRELALEPIEHPWLDDQRKPLILSVGRLAKQKNYPVLLEAVALLRRERPLRLLILGEGPSRSELEARVRSLGLEEIVQLPGRVRNPYPYIARADVFALSSEEEAFGLVVLEAMVLGSPVVATDCSGPSAILRRGACGALVPSQDPYQLAEGIARILDDESYRTGIVRAGLQRAEDFEPRRIASEWLRFIAQTKSPDGL